MVQSPFEIDTVVRVLRVSLFAIKHHSLVFFVCVIKAIDALQITSERYHLTIVSLLKVHLVSNLIEAAHAH